MKNTLQFNNQEINTVLKDGQWWVAIKPICEALNLNYSRQAENVRNDEILSQLSAKQHLVAADNKQRQMLCLPEKFIYGWLFSVRSSSPELLQYKRECYEVLFEHFHGTITQRQKILSERIADKEEMDQLIQELKEDDRYKRLQVLSANKGKHTKALNKLDADIISKQMKLDI